MFIIYYVYAKHFYMRVYLIVRSKSLVSLLLEVTEYPDLEVDVVYQPPTFTSSATPDHQIDITIILCLYYGRTIVLPLTYLWILSNIIFLYVN